MGLCVEDWGPLGQLWGPLGRLWGPVWRFGVWGQYQAGHEGVCWCNEIHLPSNEPIGALLEPPSRPAVSSVCSGTTPSPPEWGSM